MTFTDRERDFILHLVQNERQKYSMSSSSLGEVIRELGESIIKKLSEGAKDGDQGGSGGSTGPTGGGGGVEPKDSARGTGPFQRPEDPDGEREGGSGSNGASSGLALFGWKS